MTLVLVTGAATGFLTGIAGADTTTTTTTATLTGSAVLGAGGTITDTATITGDPTAGFPDGSVSFYECGPSVVASTCSSSGTPYNTVTLSGSGDVATASSTPAFTPTGGVGYYCFAAVYTPGSPETFSASVSHAPHVALTPSNYTGSTDNTTGDTVDPAECVDITPAPSTTVTTLDDASTNAPWTGKETSPATAYDTSTVTGISTFPVTGTVTYSFFTNGICTAPAASTQTVTMSGGTVPNSASTAPLAAGNYSFDAVYSGSTNYHPSAVSSCEPFTVSAPTAVTPVVAAATGITTSPAPTLALTGAYLFWMTEAGLAFLGLGGLLVITSRRRRIPRHAVRR